MDSANPLIIGYFGHATFKLITPRRSVIYIDPFASGDYSDNADLVLITHEHFDHNQISFVATDANTKVIRSKDCIKIADDNSISYISFDIDGVSIEPVPACNKNHPITQCVGFVITIDGIKLYFAGDTSKTAAMESYLPTLGIDYAFLPSDGIYNMGIEEASECAKLIEAKHVAVIHTVGVSSPDDIAFDEKKAASLDADGAFVFKPGTSLEIAAQA